MNGDSIKDDEWELARNWGDGMSAALIHVGASVLHLVEI